MLKMDSKAFQSAIAVAVLEDQTDSSTGRFLIYSQHSRNLLKNRDL